MNETNKLKKREMNQFLSLLFIAWLPKYISQKERERWRGKSIETSRENVRVIGIDQ